jgi:hypothetical protein
MKSTGVVCLFATALIGWAVRAEELPGVDQLIARAPHGQAPPTIVLRGRCEASNPEETGAFEIWISSPRVALNLSDGSVRTAFDGQQLWRRQAGLPPAMLPPGPLVNAVAIFDPARRLHWKELYPKIAVLRREPINERPALVVETEPRATRFYIDDQSGHLLRADILPGLTFEMSDYREVDGWPIPFQVVQKTPRGDVYTFHIAKAEHSAIDEAVFAPPKPEAR